MVWNKFSFYLENVRNHAKWFLYIFSELYFTADIPPSENVEHLLIKTSQVTHKFHSVVTSSKFCSIKKIKILYPFTNVQDVPQQALPANVSPFPYIASSKGIPMGKNLIRGSPTKWKLYPINGLESVNGRKISVHRIHRSLFRKFHPLEVLLQRDIWFRLTELHKKIKFFTWSDPIKGSLKWSLYQIPLIGLRIGLPSCGNSCPINGA